MNTVLLRLAERIYQALYHLFPRDFLHASQDDAMELFRDLFRRAYRDQGALGALTFSGRAYLRLLPSAARERWSGRSIRARPGDGTLVSSAERLVHDGRIAIRSWRRKPLFATVVVAIIAMGVGATTTIYSVVDAVLLKALPYPDAERLVIFEHGSHSILDYKAWSTRTNAFADMAAGWGTVMDLTEDGSPERLGAAGITADFFELLGAEPALGRLFTEDDYDATTGAAVLDFGLWQRRFGADPTVLGRTLVLDDEQVTIVGVLGPRFRSPELMFDDPVGVWLPLDLDEPDLQSWGLHVLEVVARLAPDRTLVAAQAELDVLSAEIATETDRRQRADGTPEPIDVAPMMEASVGEARASLYLLFGAVGFMLLIACANLANLSLANGAERSREMALRAAMGARRARIVRQLLSESVLLSVTGGALGIVIAYWGVHLFGRFAPTGLPRADNIGVDWRVLTFAVAVSMATGVLFGILPALQAARTDVNQALKLGATTGRKPLALRNFLVVSEVSLALVLLVGAGLLFNSFLNVHRIEVGFETDKLLVLPLSLGPRFTEAERVQFAQQLVPELAAVAGVEDVGAAVLQPFMIHGEVRCCWRTRLKPVPLDATTDGIRSIVHPVGPGYFRVLGAPFLEGRGFERPETTTNPIPAVVNASIARKLFGDGSPVGRSFMIGDDELSIVGLVDDIRHWGQAQEVEDQVYVPYSRFGGHSQRFQVAVKTLLEPDSLVGPLRDAVWSVEPSLPVPEVVTMRQLVGRSKAEPLFYAVLLVLFAGLAATLAIAGLYGTLAYLVGQSRKEVGIRMALGAQRSDVLGLILKRGMSLTITGIAFGIVGAIALSKSVETMVFGITPTDPTTIGAISALLAAIALAASYFPARRASLTNPVTTLRAE